MTSLPCSIDCGLTETAQASICSTWARRTTRTRCPDEDPTEWPRISGVHGVFKHLDDVVGGQLEEGDDSASSTTSSARASAARQVRAASHADQTLEKLFDLVPPGTWVVVTSDHGELFGEAGYFGHGPIAHEKVFEVPFVEGLIR